MAASTEVQTPRVVSDQLFLPSEESQRTSYLLIAHLCVLVDKLQLVGGAKSAAEGYVQRSRFLGVLPGNPGGVAQAALTKNSVAGPWLILNEGLVAGLTAQGLVVVGVGDLSKVSLKLFPGATVGVRIRVHTTMLPQGTPMSNGEVESRTLLPIAERRFSRPVCVHTQSHSKSP